MDRNRHLHTCFHSLVSLRVAIARLESPEGASALIGEKERNVKTSQPRMIVPF
jgi:hypothetical protein